MHLCDFLDPKVKIVKVGKVSTNFAAAKNGKVGSIFAAAKLVLTLPT